MELMKNLIHKSEKTFVPEFIDQKSPSIKVSVAQRSRLKRLELSLEEEQGHNIRACDVIQVLLDMYEDLDAKGKTPKIKLSVAEESYCDALVKEIRRNSPDNILMLQSILGRHLGTVHS